MCVCVCVAMAIGVEAKSQGVRESSVRAARGLRGRMRVCMRVRVRRWW